MTLFRLFTGCQRSVGKMRCSAVALTALLFLTGTQARFLWQNEEPQGPTQRAQALVQAYVQQGLELGKEAISQVESSEYGKKLDIKIMDKLNTLLANAGHMHKQLAPYMEQAREQVAKEYSRDLSVVKDKIQPIVEQFLKRFEQEMKDYQQRLAPLGGELRQQASQNLEAWSKKLLPVAEEFRDKVRAEADKVRTAIAPLSEEMQQQVAKKMEELRSRIGPNAQEYRDQLNTQIEIWRKKFGPALEGLKDLIPHAEEVRSKLNSLYETAKAQVAPAA